MNLTAPEGVRNELRRGLAWHEEGHSGDGLKPETVAWARRLADGAEITRDKAVKMRAWLARHEADKSGKGFTPGDGYPSPGRVAWALWGGDPAVGWSEKLVRHFESEESMKKYSMEERKAMAEKGEAMADGSFPIANGDDLKAAMSSIGRAKDPEKAKAHIRRRAKALKLSDMLTPAFKPGKVGKGDVYGQLWDPPDLPIPCTPADLTAAMLATMPTEMQDAFCAIWNALASPLPTGAGMDDDRAFGLAMELLCYEHGWTRRPDGSYARVQLVADGMEYGEGMEKVDARASLDRFRGVLAHVDFDIDKAGRVLSAANEAKIRAAHGALGELLASVAPAAEPEEMGKGQPISLTFDFAKMESNDEKRQVFGWGYLCKDDSGAPVVDVSGDIVDPESLQKAAYSGFNKLFAGMMHKGKAAARVITLAWVDPEVRKAMGASDPGKKAGLWIGFQVESDELWKDIKGGKFPAFSIGGKGVRTPL